MAPLIEKCGHELERVNRASCKSQYGPFQVVDDMAGTSVWDGTFHLEMHGNGCGIQALKG
jgi:hypothetical protein